MTPGFLEVAQHQLVLTKGYFNCFHFLFKFCPKAIFHDSKFEVGMASRSQVVATYVILIDVYML